MARGPGSGLHREAIEQDGDVVRESLRVSADSPYFEGHFERFAIFPAVAQLHAIVVALAHERYAGLGALREARRLKFLRPVRPGASLELSLDRNGQKVTFKLLVDGEPASAGTLEFAEP